MEKIIRLFPDTLKAVKYKGAAPQGQAAVRLQGFVKDKGHHVYGIIGEDGYFAMYFVIIPEDGGKSLMCSYYEELVPGTINPLLVARLLDHTGYDVLKIVAPNPHIEAYLNKDGFQKLEQLYMGTTQYHKELIVVEGVENISGDKFFKLPTADVERLSMLFHCAVGEETSIDPLARFPSGRIMPSECMARIENFQCETFIFREDKIIIAIGQVERLTPEYVGIVGIYVLPEHRRRGIAKHVLNAMIRHASQYTPDIYATILGNNEASLSLFTKYYGFQSKMVVYGMTRDPSIISWKKPVSGGQVKEPRPPILKPEEPTLREEFRAKNPSPRRPKNLRALRTGGFSAAQMK